jgi:hypothetical protein
VGHGVILAYIAIGLICSVLYYILVRRENQRREAGWRDEVIEGKINPNAKEENGQFKSVEEARGHKGDGWSGFRYTL